MHGEQNRMYATFLLPVVGAGATLGPEEKRIDIIIFNPKMVHWLDLIPPDVEEYAEPFTSNTCAAGRIRPTTLSVWDVAGEVLNDTTQFADIAVADRSSFSTNRMYTDVVNKEQLRVTFLHNICANFNETLEFTSFKFASAVRLPQIPPTATIRPHRTCIRSTADIAAWDSECIYATVELETKNNLHLPSDMRKFCTDYNNSIGTAYNKATYSGKMRYKHEPGEELRKGAEAISRAVGQMMDVGTKYGILSCYSSTYFLRATSPTSVEISSAVPNNATAPSLLRTIAYVLNTARNDASEPFIYPERAPRGVPLDSEAASAGDCGDNANSTDDTCDPDEGSEAEDFSHKSDPDPSSPLRKRPRGSDRSGRSGPGTKPPAGSSCRPGGFMASTHSLQRTHASWQDLHVMRRFAQGRSGAVVAVQWLGAEVAVKVHAVHLTEGRARYEKEKRNYKVVADCQGEFVPRVLFRTVRSPSGFLAGIGLELCQALPLSIAEWTAEQRRSAQLALRALCERHSLLQRDLRAENFCLNAHGKVVVIDLEDCDIEQRAAAKKAYLREVAHMFPM